MKLFDNKVQETKYKVLREVAYQTWKGNDAFTEFNEIANNVIPKGEPPQTCCIYKDRAVVAERIRLALGGSKNNDNIVQVIDIACDECPEAGYVVTDLCRGCLAHSCVASCKRNAIVIDEHQHAHIDKSKCVECGRCAKACQYSAIHNFQRPCERACKVNAISMAPGGEAAIDYEKCINCGACVYHCPFGATVDVSSIVSVIREIMAAEEKGEDEKVIAIVAPSIASQFLYASLGQVITGIKELGFDEVLEVAVGAEMVAYKEGLELKEKGFLTSSCCPAFVKYIETKKDTVSQYVDYAITFEELQALFDSKNIELKKLKWTDWNQASYYGRIFATTGGVSAAVEQMLKELKVKDFEFNPIVCDGIDKCRTALLRASKGLLPNNFIEGMACVGGCIGGSGNLVRYEDAPEEMEDHIEDAVSMEMLPNVKKNINIF